MHAPLFFAMESISIVNIAVILEDLTFIHALPPQKQRKCCLANLHHLSPILGIAIVEIPAETLKQKTILFKLVDGCS